MEYIYVTLGVLIFSLFDWVGFVWLDNRKGTMLYRVVQALFQIMISMVLLCLTDWIAVLAANIMWLFLVCDVVFYWIDNTPLEPFTWFSQSPVNFIYQKILGKPTPVVAVLLSASLGVVIGYGILYFL
jgi:hypothetical protein